MEENTSKINANHRRYVLIVDDEEINRQMLGFIIGNDYDVMYASNGCEALDILHENSYRISLILLDIMMPEMNGYELLEVLRNDMELRKIPVIVLTSEKSAEVDSLRMGAVDFIPKPYDMPDVILARVRRSIKLAEDNSLLSATEQDSMTGLYNKGFFYVYADMHGRLNPDMDMDAVVVDINRLHIVNDLYGRAYGDQVIRRLAGRIKHYSDEHGGYAARSDGDMFYLYIPHTDDCDALLKELGKDLRLNDDDIQITLRMGIYQNADRSIGVEACFDKAENACKTVRNTYASSYSFYDSKMHEKELYDEQLLGEVDTALAEGQFKVYFQPKYNIRGGRPVLSSAEALVRWIHPTLGFISPGAFIPLFEKNGLILKLDKYVWQKSAEQMRIWKEKYGVVIPVSVNISRMDIYEPGLEDEIRRIAAAEGIANDAFLLEITESAYTDNSDYIISVVNSLRSSGFRIEMDDFGSGYSSLSMLASLPVDVLKIDMAFVRNITTSEKDYRMIRLMIDVAGFMGMTTVAEGVETKEQLDLLGQAGCDVIQGYYFSKPVPPDEFEQFIEKEMEESKNADS